ncbi:MAG: NAD(P)/FAD-dependent oxidoreductase [Flavobacterium sp.]|nr:MAG: NAD(P)/FAD-dependent oxidoreductase [Flavobacterium sp.]
MHQKEYDIVIIGGGLAGLCTALHLQRHHIRILLIEKQEYPKHRVCGEYVSNEVLPYLNTLGIDPQAHGAITISRFEISTREGETIESDLPLGGFGISRYALDKLLFDALDSSTNVLFDTAVSITYLNDEFTVLTQNKKAVKCRFVVGSFGKRSLLDKRLGRDFINKRTHWMAVKAHYDFDFPEDMVALHNFEGGYCGLSKTETGAVNACYLTTLKSFNKANGIEDFQKTIMSKNKKLDYFFKNARQIFEKSLSISQISFAKKSVIHNHIFMLGDSAGLIHPLCGNGMAMAIHAAKIFSEIYLEEIHQKNSDREVLESAYQNMWKTTFSERLRAGARIQRLLLNDTASAFTYKAISRFPSILPYVIRKTHGSLMV